MSRNAFIHAGSAMSSDDAYLRVYICAWEQSLHCAGTYHAALTSQFETCFASVAATSVCATVSGKTTIIAA